MANKTNPFDANKQKLWSAKLEREFASKLKQVARKIDQLVKRMYNGSVDSAVDVFDALHAYSEQLRPWAEQTALGVLHRANMQNYRLFQIRSEHIGAGLRREVMKGGSPVQQVMQHYYVKHVELITSLPKEAAERIMNLATTGYVSGKRVGEIRRLGPSAYGPLELAPEGLAKEILKTGEVTASRANMIARTETTSVSTELTKARAQYIGSETYVWRTSRDSAVRYMHKKLEGTIHRWDDPPVAELGGQRHHPGQFPNCRCHAQPVIPERFFKS